MTHINHNLKVRRKNKQCTKMECDMAKAFAGAFQDIIEDNKRMKDAIILFSHYLQGDFNYTIPLDFHDEMIETYVNCVANGIQELKERCNDKSE